MSSPYSQGFAAGKEKNYVRRGLMRLGASCAGDSQSAFNTEEWLRGFTAGEERANNPDHVLTDAWSGSRYQRKNGT